MLRWFRKTYPSYNLQPLLLKRYRELEEARAFNNWLGEHRQAQEGQRHLDGRAPPGTPAALRAGRAPGRPRFEQVVGYLERNEPLPLDQPDRKATSFVTSHFYLDDFVQSSKDPNPRPLQHTPLHPEDGFRTPAEVTDEDVRLARRYQGYGGTRFVEDDLAGDPRPARWPATGRGRPPSRTVCAALQTARRRQRTS